MTSRAICGEKERERMIKRKKKRKEEEFFENGFNELCIMF